MDRREAIDVIRLMRHQLDRDVTIYDGFLFEALTQVIEKQHEALDLAIEALEREIEYGQMVVDFAKGETMKSDEWKYDTTCDAESATTTDCISRADTIKAMCQGCKVFLDDEFNCADCADVAIVKGMPSVNQKQITGKLKNTCNDVDELTKRLFDLPTIEVNEDCISRKHAIEAIEEEDWYHVNSKGELVHGSTSEEESWYKADDIYKAIESLPPVTPPKKIVAQINIDIEELIERIKEEYGITNKVGEWVRQYCFQQWKCSECEYEIDGKTNYCPNCGAKMRGDKVKQAFEECERFIDECTQEELSEYKKSLNIDPKDYESEILHGLESYSDDPWGAKMGGDKE